VRRFTNSGDWLAHWCYVVILAIKLLLAPGFVIVATLCLRRFGPVVGGAVSGLPVIAGPILLVLALEHGEQYLSRAASGTSLGLISLSVFIVAYGAVCRAHSWLIALPAGWLSFVAATALFSKFGLSSNSLLTAVVAVCFLVALAVLPRPNSVGITTISASRWDLPARAGLAVAMVVLITWVSGLLGPHLSGLLAPSPVITGIMAAFTQAQLGSNAALETLRGMIYGLFGFEAFCVVLTTTALVLSVPWAFVTASVAAVTTQAVVLGARRARASGNSRHARVPRS